MGFVDDAFRRREEAAYVDPQISVDEAYVKVCEEIPRTLQALIANGLPEHRYAKFRAREVWHGDKKRWAWVNIIGVTRLMHEGVHVGERDSKALAVCINDEVTPPQLQILYNEDIDRYSYVEANLRKLNPPQAWSLLVFLKALQEPPKVMPWDN